MDWGGGIGCHCPLSRKERELAEGTATSCAMGSLCPYDDTVTSFLMTVTGRHPQVQAVVEAASLPLCPGTEIGAALNPLPSHGLVTQSWGRRTGTLQDASSTPEPVELP